MQRDYEARVRFLAIRFLVAPPLGIRRPYPLALPAEGPGRPEDPPVRRGRVVGRSRAFNKRDHFRGHLRHGVDSSGQDKFGAAPSNDPFGCLPSQYSLLLQEYEDRLLGLQVLLARPAPVLSAWNRNKPIGNAGPVQGLV